MKHSYWLKGITAGTGMLLLAGPLSSVFAAMVSPLTVYTPGKVLMIDGTDSNVTVNVTVVDSTQPLVAYDFGFVTGSGYTRITSGNGSWVFNGGDIVDFALRSRGSDAMFGTGDDVIYSISNPLDYADQIYMGVIAASYSQNPVVSSDYYKTLKVQWDLNQDGTPDTGFALAVSTSPGSKDGMAPAPVPLPAAMWLFGSGLLGLISVVSRRRV